MAEQHQSLANELKKEIDELKKDIDETKKEMRKKEKEKKDLEKEVRKLKTWISKKDSQCNRLEKIFENNKDSHANEMRQLTENNRRELEKVNNKIEKLKRKQKEDMRSTQLRNEDLEKEKASLQEENNNLSKLCKNVPNPLEKYYLCIGQLCSDLQANMYQYVLPADYSGEGWSYKFRDIKEGIEAIDDNEEKQQALERLDLLKKKINWEEIFEGAINMLQRERNQVAHPEILNAEVAQEAAQNLNKEGRLKGKIRYERVLKIIQTWKQSVKLLNQNNN